jgi:regulator of sirC expression with transglutaminase-like and TPR domain
MKISEIQALITLLEDPDQEIFQQVKEKIVAHGHQIVPFLEDQWSNQTFGPEFMNRIEDIIQEIQIAGVKTGLEQWLHAEDRSLLDGAILVAKVQYPQMDEFEVKDFISKLRQEIWLELNDNLTAFEKVKVINHFFYNEYGFSGNKTDYHSPKNSMINKVIETRTGNPLLLSVLYIIIAQSLDIPIFGINLPNHFVVAYREDEFLIDESFSLSEDGILFYINPFGQGAILHRTEIDNFLSHLDIDADNRFVSPCEDVDIIKRMLNNLMVSFNKSKKESKVEEVRLLLSILDPMLAKKI